MVDQQVVATLIDDAAAVISGAGIASPRRVARRLWAELGHAPGIDAAVHAQQPVNAGMAATYMTAAGRIAAGEPMQYVTGRAGFRQLWLAVDHRVLIPRPETEGLVELALARVSTGTAIDIGTGSGAVAIALATEGRFDTVVGVDLSPDALAVARVNGREARAAVRWVRGDLATAVGRADLVVSNPPYLSRREYEGLDASVRAHEPRIALESGDDGLEATRRLLADARRVLRAGGWLAVELDTTRAEESAAIARALGWIEVTVRDDLFGRARYLLARSGGA